MLACVSVTYYIVNELFKEKPLFFGHSLLHCHFEISQYFVEFRLKILTFMHIYLNSVYEMASFDWMSINKYINEMCNFLFYIKTNGSNYFRTMHFSFYYYLLIVFSVLKCLTGSCKERVT